MKRLSIFILLLLSFNLGLYAQFDLNNSALRMYDQARGSYLKADAHSWVNDIVPYILKSEENVKEDFIKFPYINEVGKYYLLLIFEDKQGYFFDVLLLRNNIFYEYEPSKLHLRYFKPSKIPHKQRYGSGKIDLKSKRKIESIEKSIDRIKINMDDGSFIEYNFDYKEEIRDNDVYIELMNQKDTGKYGGFFNITTTRSLEEVQNAKQILKQKNETVEICNH